MKRNLRNSGQRLFPSSSVKFLATSAAKSATFLRTFLFGSFWTQLIICSFKTAFCSSGSCKLQIIKYYSPNYLKIQLTFPKNSSNSLLKSLLSITAERDRPSSDISATFVTAPNNIVTFCSMGRAS